MQKTCCVTGHREIPIEKVDFVKGELKREIVEALENDYRVFITGFAKGVDMLFASLVDEQRTSYPGIFLEAAIPYRNRISNLSEEEKAVLSKCDGVNFVCDEWSRDCYFVRNRYMVGQSSRVIAVFDKRIGGGTGFTMDYARMMERCLRIISLE